MVVPKNTTTSLDGFIDFCLPQQFDKLDRLSHLSFYFSLHLTTILPTVSTLSSGPCPLSTTQSSTPLHCTFRNEIIVFAIIVPGVSWQF